MKRNIFYLKIILILNRGIKTTSSPLPNFYPGRPRYIKEIFDFKILEIRNAEILKYLNLKLLRNSSTFLRYLVQCLFVT